MTSTLLGKTNSQFYEIEVYWDRINPFNDFEKQMAKILRKMLGQVSRMPTGFLPPACRGTGVLGGFLFGIHLLFGSLYAASAAVPENPISSPVRRALLIGIGDYQVLPDLPGAHNDIALIQHILTNRFGFLSNDVRVLADSEATRAGILQALTRLVNEAGENDMVYFHYSGHGSQVQDVNGDEQDDHLDETIVPADGRTPGIPDITDDELEAVLGRLKTSHAIFVFDSCHSGTVTRGVAVHARYVPPDSRLSLYEQLRRPSRGVVPVLSQRYILLTGAAANQPALDGPIHGHYHGFFTYSLFQSLVSTPLNVTTKVLFETIQEELGQLKNELGRTFMPEPQLEAPKSSLTQPFFFVPSPETEKLPKRVYKQQHPWVSVKSDGKTNPRLIKGGREGGVGTVWALFPPEAKAFVPDKAMAYGLTIKKRGLDAIIRVEPSGVIIPDNSKAMVLARPASSGSIRVQLRDVPAAAKGQIATALQKQLKEIQVVQPGETAQFVIDMNNNQVQVLSADGLEEVKSFTKEKTGDSFKQLASFLSRSLHVNELLALENPSSQIQLHARIVQPQQGRPQSLQKKESDHSMGIAHIRRRGEPRSSVNSLQLELQTNRDCYITIVDVDSEGTVNVLFPNNYQKPTFYPEGFIKAGTKILIPDSFEKKNKAGFHWDFAEPGGTDTIRVFAATDREIARQIRDQLNAVNSKMRGAVRGGKTASDAVVTGIRKLRQDLVKTLTRGIVTIPDGADEYLQNIHTAGFGKGPTLSVSKPSLSYLGRKQLSNEPLPDWTAVTLTVRVQP